MKCSEYVLLISGHLDGANTKAQEAELKKHLNACEKCRKLLNKMQENDRLLKADIDVPDLSKSIMSEVRKNKRSKKPFYISLAASGLAAAAALALVFGGKNAPMPQQPQETQAPEMRSVEYIAQEAAEESEFVSEGAYFDYSATEYKGLMQAAATSKDAKTAALVIHADPSQIEFAGSRMSEYDLSSIQSKTDYDFSDRVTAVYSVSWEVLEQIVADCEGVFELDQYYEEATIYDHAIVIFVAD